MKKPQRVYLHGDTLVLAGVRATLEANPAFEIIDLDSSHEIRPDLLLWDPDVIIIDTSLVPYLLQSHLFDKWAGLLIGVNPDINQVQFWIGKSMKMLSANDLGDVILRYQKEFNTINTLVSEE